MNGLVGFEPYLVIQETKLLDFQKKINLHHKNSRWIVAHFSTSPMAGSGYLYYTAILKQAGPSNA